MKTEQPGADLSAVQAAIYRVALSLDSFLLNGIPYGVLSPIASSGFLHKTAGSLLSDLANLERELAQAPGSGQAEVREVIAALTAKCQELVNLVTGLPPVRTVSLDEVRPAMAHIPVLREACVRLIQTLESQLRTPKPFYQTRSADSTASVNHFLGNLDRLFAEAWRAPGD